MSTYADDPRVTVLYPDWWWLVSVEAPSFWYLCPTGQFAVVKGDDGLYRVFEDEPGRGGVGAGWAIRCRVFRRATSTRSSTH